MANMHAHDHYSSEANIKPAFTAARMALPHLLPGVQRLVFTEDFTHGDTILLELTEDMVSELENGSRFVVRGNPLDSAVLCTQDRTFDIKARETSNTMLVSPDLRTARALSKDGDSTMWDVQITSMHTEFLELRTLVPRWNVAKHLLEQNPFSGLDNEKAADVRPKAVVLERGLSWESFQFVDKVSCRKSFLHTLSQLAEIVQSSEAELLHYLQDVLPACEINGYWRLLETEYTWSLCKRVMEWVSDNSLDSENIPQEEAETALFRSEPASVMHGFFWRRFANKIADFFRISELEIRRQFCRMLLRKNPKILISALDQALQNTVGSGFVPQDIEGFAYVCLDDKLSPSNNIEYFPKEDLPTDPEARFQTLFDTRARWTKEEISPYVKDIVLPGQTVDQLLYKYARTFVDKRNMKRRTTKTDEHVSDAPPPMYFVAISQI